MDWWIMDGSMNVWMNEWMNEVWGWVCVEWGGKLVDWLVDHQIGCINIFFIRFKGIFLLGVEPSACLTENTSKAKGLSSRCV